MTKSLKDVAKAMQKIDFCMLTTRAAVGSLASRPMSNNGEVAYDGTSWFFTDDKTRMVSEIAADPNVALTLSGDKSLLGAPGIFVAIEGTAKLIRDKAAFAEHWTKDLDRWFEQGIDTPGLVMIEVAGGRLHYWDGEEEGELTL